MAGGGGDTTPPPANRAPTARLTASATSCTAPCTINFNASTSSDPDGDSLGYSYNFGDGATGSGATASHGYTNTGAAAVTRTVVVTVSDGKGGSDTEQLTVTINPTPPPVDNPPTAALSASPTSLVAGQSTTFTVNGSDDKAGFSCDLDFGDGSAHGSACTGTVPHGYATAGSYSARLTVTASNAATASKAVTISVSEPPDNPPTAAFSAKQVARKIALDFDASASSDPEGKALTYSWDFGDSTSGTGKTVSHTYSVAGKWSVKLTVKDPANQAGTKTSVVVASVCNAPSDGGVAIDGTKSTNFAINQPACPEFAGVGTQVFGLKTLQKDGVGGRVRVYGDPATGVARYLVYVASNADYTTCSKSGGIEQMAVVRDKALTEIDKYVDMASWFDRVNMHCVTGTSEVTGLGQAVINRIDANVTNRQRALSVVRIEGPYNMQHPDGIISRDMHEMTAVYPINKAIDVFDMTNSDLYMGASNLTTASVGGWKTKTDNGDGTFTTDSDDVGFGASRVGGFYLDGLGFRNGLKAGFELYPMGLDTVSNVVARLQGGVAEVCKPDTVTVTEGSGVYVKRLSCTIEQFTASQIEAMYAAVGRVPNVSRSRKAHTTLPIFVFDETAMPTTQQMADAVAGIQFEDRHINETFTFPDRNGGKPLFTQSQTFSADRTIMSPDVLRSGVTVSP